METPSKPVVRAGILGGILVLGRGLGVTYTFLFIYNHTVGHP